MIQTRHLTTQQIKVKSITAVLAVALSVALPQIFHAVGLLSGMGNALGAAFLPMHIPVLLAGLLAGPIVGVVAGGISPLISFAISGMPAAALLPFMMIELAAYGLIAGFLCNVRMPVFVKVLLIQVGGRLARAAAILISVYAFSNTTIGLEQAWNVVVIGLPGILLQWLLIPLLIYRCKDLKKYYE